MKIRSSVFWFLIFVAVLIAWMLWHGRRQAGETRPTASVETNRVPQAVAAPTSLPAAPAPATQNVVTVAPQDKGEQIKEGLTKLNDAPIVFYGRLEDQFGSPVVGAQIAASIRIYNASDSTVDRFSATSDANGLFQISRGRGESLSVVPSKSGYVLATTSTYFKYSYMYSDRFTPDPNNPTVIKMWKLQGAEPLVDISKEYRLPFTNAPILFDLVTGKVVSNGGDLEVLLTRASGSLSKKNPGDWSIELKPVDGGIVESEYHAAQVTFEAPADTYQSDYLVQMNRDDPAWFDNIQKELFLKSRNGQVYSKFYLVFGINREPNDLLYFQFKGVANTNGSRNWEATVPSQ